MRIEAHGGFQSPKKETRPLRFCCTNCHCKFVADPGEYIEGKKNTNAYSCGDPKPRIKFYASVCPECNEVVLLSDSCARFEDNEKLLTPFNIWNMVGHKVKVKSERADVISGIYKIDDCTVYDVAADMHCMVKATLTSTSLRGEDGSTTFKYDSENVTGIWIYEVKE